jgi:predicted Holliday junction resolvase-like endonuclease
MPTPSLPPTSLWEQYSVVGVLVLVVALLFFAAWKIYKEYQTWQSGEQEKQRVWQEEQSKLQREWQIEQGKVRDAEQLKRDQFWQEQVKQLNLIHVDQDKSTASVLAKVIERMDALTMVITLHDERAKDAIKEFRK